MSDRPPPQVVDAIDEMHRLAEDLYDTKHWITVGRWLDVVKPLGFWRNTGELRGGNR